MQVKSNRSLSSLTAGALIAGVYPGRRPGQGNAGLFRKLGWARRALADAGFEGSSGQVAVLPAAGADLPPRIVFVGLGDEVDLETLRQAAGAGRRAVDDVDVVATTLHQTPIDGAGGAVLEGLALAGYRFDAYRSRAVARPEPVFEFLGGSPVEEKAVARAMVVVEAVSLARDLVNEPSAAKGPMAFAGRVASAADGSGLSVDVWDAERLAAERMGGILGVGAGSDMPPCLLVLTHKPRRAKRRLALVGKGITFDSGGLSLKTAQFMESMKTDMSGAAAVCAAAIAIARLGLPIELVAYAPLAENMPGGGAQRPGDVLKIRNGKTIEVLNTDAEGRLVLADALSLAAETGPDLIVDVATLTGACRVALGDKIGGLFGTDGAVPQVAAAARSAGERLWPLPLPADYRSNIDSEIADMKNTGGSRYGGAIAAALLLQEFVGDSEWAHMDIAGPARAEKGEHYVSKGGTGFGVRTLLELAESLGQQ